MASLFRRPRTTIDTTPLTSSLEDTFPSSDFESDSARLLSPLSPPESATPWAFSYPRVWQARSPRIIITILFAIGSILTFGGGLITVPSLRIFEQILCHYHYNDLNGDEHIGFDERIDEGMCKGTEVQERLNVLLAAYAFLGTIPALFTTVLYGLLADRIGRRPVFALSIIGMIINTSFNFIIMALWKVLPLHLVLISPLFVVIGGGEPVAIMMFYAIGNDVIEEAERANIFLWGGCATLISELIAPSLASSLMIKSPWIPILIGLGLQVLGTFLLLFIPETLHFKLSPSADLSLSPFSNPEPSTKQTSFLPALKTNFRDTLTRLYSATKVLRSLPIILLLISFVTSPFGRVSSELSMRYISNRYNWTLAQAGFLLSLRAFINILLLLAIIPLISSFLLSRLRLSSNHKDLLLVQASAIFLIFGSAIMGFAPTIGIGITGMVIWTLGTGFTALTRSLITSLVQKRHVGALYAAISIVETCSMMLGGPVQASLYALGLKWRGMWEGLPYFMLAGISAVAGVAVWWFGLLMKGRLEEGAVRLGDEVEEEEDLLEAEFQDDV